MKFISLLLVAVLAIPTGQAWAQGQVINRILVKINNNIITQYDLDERLAPILEQLKGRELSPAEQEKFREFQKQALADMVNDVLLDQEVMKYGVTISEEDIDHEIERIKLDRKVDDAGFEELIAQDGLTIDDFREKLKKTMEKQEVVRHKVSKKVLVTDSEIEEEYKARKAEYTLDKTVEVGLLLLPADVSATEVHMRVKDGEMTFAEAVAKYSVGPAADSGGSLGEMNYDDLSEEWRLALRGVPVGGMSEPFMLQGQEALLSLIKLSEDNLVPLEDVRDELYAEMTAKKRQQIFDEYFEELKNSAVIIYTDKSMMIDDGVTQ